MLIESFSVDTKLLVIVPATGVQAMQAAMDPAALRQAWVGTLDVEVMQLTPMPSQRAPSDGSVYA